MKMKLIEAIKNKKLNDWFYYFKNGHEKSIFDESDIIIQTRLYDYKLKYLTDKQIQKIIRLRIESMYEKKYPNAKKYSFNNF